MKLKTAQPAIVDDVRRLRLEASKARTRLERFSSTDAEISRKLGVVASAIEDLVKVMDELDPDPDLKAEIGMGADDVGEPEHSA